MLTQIWFPFLATFLPFEIKTKKKTQVMELRGRESLGQIDFIAYESDDTKSVTKNCDCNIFDVNYPTEVQCGWIYSLPTLVLSRLQDFAPNFRSRHQISFEESFFFSLILEMTHPQLTEKFLNASVFNL